MINSRPPVDWLASHPAEIMVCDQDGTILDMSGTSIKLYEKQGGALLIGRNVFAHHREPSRSHMLEVVNQRKHVIYTTEKVGSKKLVSVAPWYRDSEYAGFVLIVLDLPGEMKNIIKD